MFGTKEDKKKLKRAGASTNSSAVTIISHGCQFTGKLYCRGSSRIGGRIEGEIVSDGLLIIEEEAYVAAKIKVDDILIQGHVRGTLEALGRVELDSSCRFEGEITTPSLIIKDGALFNGRASMPDSKESAKNVEPLLKKSSQTVSAVPKEEVLISCSVGE